MERGRGGGGECEERKLNKKEERERGRERYIDERQSERERGGMDVSITMLGKSESSLQPCGFGDSP